MHRSTIVCSRAAVRSRTVTSYPSPCPSGRPPVDALSACRSPRARTDPFVCSRCLHTSTRRLHPTTTTSDSQRPTPSPQSSKPHSAYGLFPTTFTSGPPPSGAFEIDASTLRREFLQLQAKAHPDRHIDPTLKAKAEATSAALNDAYRTLLDPLLRARHILLVQAGIDLEGDEGAKEEDQTLLMSVLEAREVIEEAEEESQLDGLRKENDERIQESVDALEKKFGDGNWEEAKMETVRLRYWMNIRDSIRGWEKGKPVVLVH